MRIYNSIDVFCALQVGARHVCVESTFTIEFMIRVIYGSLSWVTKTRDAEKTFFASTVNRLSLHVELAMECIKRKVLQIVYGNGLGSGVFAAIRELVFFIGVERFFLVLCLCQRFSSF